MIFVISFLMKPLATVFTDPGFVSIVYPHVSVKSGTSVECFATSLTFVWLLIGVNYFVSTQS